MTRSIHTPIRSNTYEDWSINRGVYVNIRFEYNYPFNHGKDKRIAILVVDANWYTIFASPKANSVFVSTV